MLGQIHFHKSASEISREREKERERTKMIMTAVFFNVTTWDCVIL